MYDEQKIYDMMKIAVEQEITRSNHILWDRIIWINGKNTEQYTKRLANERLVLIWLKPLYPEVGENPYKHLDRLQDDNMEKWNFFESTVTNYTQSSSMKWDWDF
jgi:ribonucleoside-diphosphate reductase beta chain